MAFRVLRWLTAISISVVEFRVELSGCLAAAEKLETVLGSSHLCSRQGFIVCGALAMF